MVDTKHLMCKTSECTLKHIMKERTLGEFDKPLIADSRGQAIDHLRNPITP